MGAAVDRLLGLLDAEDRYDIPLEALRPAQIAAADERLQEQRSRIRLLANRAESGGVREIRDYADLVPLLFAHTAYKGYPEGWLTEGRWERLGRWLDTISAHRVEGVDTAGVADVDDWIERLAQKGHFLSCSSGTGGKISMITASAADRAITRAVTAKTMQWATGIRPERDRLVFTVNPSGNNFRNIDATEGVIEAFGAADGDHRFKARITIGEVSRMVALRRSITEGAALPDQIAAYEALSAERQKIMDAAVLAAAEGLVANRARKAVVVGQFPLVHRVCEIIREMGHGGGDFHPENAMLVAGGLKGATLPPDYREFILATLNIAPEHIYHFYAMQEAITQHPRCAAGRYHVSPWILLLPLDSPGEQLLAPVGGVVEGRAAFFDLAVEGRWGGVISGDKIEVDYGRCACGRQGPTIGPDIVRYKDLPGGDKITCAGTIDAYVRGVA
jgi:hypothetical protein